MGKGEDPTPIRHFSVFRARVLPVLLRRRPSAALLPSLPPLCRPRALALPLPVAAPRSPAAREGLDLELAQLRLSTPPLRSPLAVPHLRMAVLATRARTASGWPWCVLIAAAVAVCWTSTLRGASAAPPSEVTRTLANGETECDVALLADGRPVLALLNSLYICNDETCSSPVQRLIEPGLTTYSAPGVRDMAVADVVVPPSNLPVALLHAGLVLCGDADCSTFVVRNVSAAVGGMPHRQCSVVRVSPTTGQPALAVAVRRPMVSGGPATTSDIDTLPDVHWVACADATCTSFAHSRVIFSSDWFLVYGLDAAFLADGRPVVAINGGAAGLDMHLVVCTDISCASTTSTALDTSTAFNSFSTPCLRILASGFPGILFADFDVGRVQLVVCTSATCTSRTTRTVYEDSSAIGYNKVAQNPTFELYVCGT